MNITLRRIRKWVVLDYLGYFPSTRQEELSQHSLCAGRHRTGHFQNTGHNCYYFCATNKCNELKIIHFSHAKHTLPLIDILLLPACWPSPRPNPSPLCWFPIWPTILPSLFLYRWCFPAAGSVCSHLVTLVPRWQIFLPWRWRRYVPLKRRLAQDLHSTTSQKTTFYIKFCSFE
jgi:hypothetical protein